MKIVALAASWLICSASLAQDQPLVGQLPPGMKLEQVMQTAQSALAARGWRITSNQTSTIEAQDRDSRIRLYVADGAIRYSDLAQERSRFRQRNEDPQQRLKPIPRERIAELRAALVATLGGSGPSGSPPRRWIVKPSNDDTVSAQYASMDTDGRLRVFIVGQELRYSDEGTRSKSSGAETTVPENWIANLRADTAKALSGLSTAQDVPAFRAPTPPPVSARTAAERNAAERLRTLKGLHDSGVITQDEYDRKRAELLKDL